MTGHVHAKEMMLYAEDSMQSATAWKKWEKLDASKGWVALDGHPNWDEDNQFRRKPLQVQINGFEVTDTRITSSADLKQEQLYYVESATDPDFWEALDFDGSDWDERAIARGVAHTSPDGAAAFCRARLGLTSGEAHG